MKPRYRNIHSRFKLNGITFDREGLKEVAYSLIKEGELFEKEIGDFMLYWLDDNPTLQVRTSGSTGKPKTIDLQKRQMVNSALATGEFFGLQPGDSALLCLPAAYIAGKMMLVRAIILGLELDYVPPSSKPLDGISKAYHFAAMVPLQLENSLQSLAQIRTLIVGGAPISQTVRIKLGTLQIKDLPLPVGDGTGHTSFLTEVFETYGMTETITHIAVKKLDVTSSGAVVQDGSVVEVRFSTPYFKALPGVFLSTDDRACLIIDAPKISEVSVITNDVVDLLSDTEFQWLGRYDNVINSGGVKLFPEQIEVKLASVIASRFFVAGFADEILGQKLVLVLEEDGAEVHSDETTLQEIQSLDILEKFEVPKVIYRVAKFQETESGKIQRQKILASLM